MLIDFLQIQIKHDQEGSVSGSKEHWPLLQLNLFCPFKILSCKDLKL